MIYDPQPEPAFEDLLACPHLQFNDAELLPLLLAYGPAQPAQRPWLFEAVPTTTVAVPITEVPPMPETRPGTNGTPTPDSSSAAPPTTPPKELPMADDLNLDRIRRDVKDVSGRRVVTDHILPTLSRLIVEDVPAMADELERLRKEVKHEKAVTRLAEQHARNAAASGAEAAAAQVRSEARYAELNAMHLREVAELNTVLEAHRQPAEGAPESEDLVKLHGQVAEALLRWHSERVVICEHTQIVSYGEAADAVVAVPMIKGLVSRLKLSQFHRGTAEAEGKRLREANKALADMMERVPEIHMRFGVLLPDGTVQPATACADWCWLCRVEQAEAANERVRALAENARGARGILCTCANCEDDWNPDAGRHEPRWTSWDLDPAEVLAALRPSDDRAEVAARIRALDPTACQGCADSLAMCRAEGGRCCDACAHPADTPKETGRA